MRTVARSTGFPTSDAQDDFLRVRRRRLLARAAAALRGAQEDADVILPFEEVLDALGRVAERDLGVQTIAVDSIVGTVDRGEGVRPPLSPDVRPRARPLGADRERPAPGRGDAARSTSTGSATCTSSRDGHHRVVGRARPGRDDIDAYVIEVVTRVPAERVHPRSATCR